MKKYQNNHPNILVVGDLMIDYYLWGDSSRVSPEAPVPVVDIQKETKVLGGAGNVVNNLIALGARVSVASVIGSDKVGDELLSMLKNLGVDNSLVVVENGRKTTQKGRVIASHQQVIRFDSETKEDISKDSEDILLNLISKSIEKFDAILISDYAKGVLTNRVLKEVIDFGKNASKKVLIDPKGKDYSKYRGTTLITPNKKEAIEATNIKIVDEESLKRAGFWLKENLALEYAIITLSEDGIAIFDEEMTKIPTVAKEVYDVTGAGDSVISTIGFILASGGDIKEACKIANASAAVVVGKLGSATATWDEIIEYERSLHEDTTEFKILNIDSLKEKVKRLKEQNRKIVFTNGCFDILHLGHIKYLQKAKSFGDVLIVGVNSDSSVKRLKGESRPINPEYDRAYLLGALESVDYVIIFEEDTPYELIKIVSPDILVKGGDYQGKKVVGSDIAKEVKLVNFIQGKSTTSIINRAKGD